MAIVLQNANNPSFFQIIINRELFQRPIQNGTFVSGHMLEGTLGLRLQKINLWISDFWYVY